MSRYTIVEKNKKGNKIGEKYTITYQLKETGYARYLIDLYCYAKEDDKYKYCFISGNEGYGVVSTEERNEFIKEFYEFQAGGSYRKTHPILMSTVEILENQLKEEKDKMRDLENKIYEAKKMEKEKIFKTYYDNIDLVDVDKYVSDIEKAIASNNKYYVSGIEYNIWEGHRRYIYDKELDKKVKVITIKDGKVISRNITVDDITL